MSLRIITWKIVGMFVLTVLEAFLQCVAVCSLVISITVVHLICVELHANKEIPSTEKRTAKEQNDDSRMRVLKCSLSKLGRNSRERVCRTFGGGKIND